MHGFLKCKVTYSAILCFVRLLLVWLINYTSGKFIIPFLNVIERLSYKLLDHNVLTDLHELGTCRCCDAGLSNVSSSVIIELSA